MILNSTGILDDYVISCYDTLHTLGKEYLIEDITEFVREKGVRLKNKIFQPAICLFEPKLPDFGQVMDISIYKGS
ncbi:MAG: DUF3791 domain-containing protein [Eubacteriales bacterium]